jgi:hypothetical protein
MTVPGGLRAPEGVFPGHLGVISLGRVILGDIAATLVDLALHQRVDVTESSSGWLVSVRDGPGKPTLAGYETAPLKELPRTPSLLSSVTPAALEQTRSALIHDGVARGWLRRLHHDQRTDRAEELVGRVRTFRRALREVKAGQGEDALTGDLLPWAVRFGLVSRTEAPLARFAGAWVDAFAELPGWRPPERSRPDFDEFDLSGRTPHAPGWQP